MTERAAEDLSSSRAVEYIRDTADLAQNASQSELFELAESLRIVLGGYRDQEVEVKVRSALVHDGHRVVEANPHKNGHRSVWVKGRFLGVGLRPIRNISPIQRSVRRRPSAAIYVCLVLEKTVENEGTVDTHKVYVPLERQSYDTRDFAFVLARDSESEPS